MVEGIEAPVGHGYQSGENKVDRERCHLVDPTGSDTRRLLPYKTFNEGVPRSVASREL